MFLGSPRCFVIVKNLKRNRQDKNLVPAHKGIFHPVAWEAAASEWAPGCLHLPVCTSNPVTPPEGADAQRVSSELWVLCPSSPGDLLLLPQDLNLGDCEGDDGGV